MAIAREPLTRGNGTLLPEEACEPATPTSRPIPIFEKFVKSLPPHLVENLVLNAVPPVLRRLTSQETYYCQICLCNCPVADGHQLQRCKHIFCSHCLRSYVETRLSEAAVYGLLCPFLPELHGNGVHGGLNAGCGHEIPDEEVQRLCGEETLVQLQRFRAMRQDENFRECPSCQTRVLGGSAARRQRTLTCPHCSLVFCFIHSNAHPGQSCWQFEMTQRLTSMRAAVHLANVSRRCPRCGMKIIKDGGCNHMTCAFCGADFCWLCGRHLSGGHTVVQRHYASWNICGCPGLQMREGLGKCPPYCLTPSMCCLRLLIPCLHVVTLIFTIIIWISWPLLWLVYFLMMIPWCFSYYCLRCLGFSPCCSPFRALAECWNVACQRHCDSDCCDSD
eukprot:symbB.v1.2.020353.t1/scaffold1703.1/size108286/5